MCASAPDICVDWLIKLYIRCTCARRCGVFHFKGYLYMHSYSSLYSLYSLLNTPYYLLNDSFNTLTKTLTSTATSPSYTHTYHKYMLYTVGE